MIITIEFIIYSTINSFQHMEDDKKIIKNNKSNEIIHDLFNVIIKKNHLKNKKINFHIFYQ